jgi:hypothetical protein
MRRGLWVALVLAAGPVATASPSPTPAPRADTSADPWPYDHLEAFGVRALGREARAEDRKAVDRGLRWLAAHQSPDGRWEARAHARWCRGEEREVAAAPTGQPAFDVGLTALAVLALLGGGYAHEDDGPLGAAADRGVRFLQRVQDDKGFFGRLTHAAQTHAQTFATLALVEAFGMTGDPRAWSSAQKARDWAANARNP